MNSTKKICNICDKSISASQIARHLVSHKTSIQCQYCPMVFNRKDIYKRHLKLHGDMAADCSVQSDDVQQVEFIIDDAKVLESIVNFKVKPPIT